MRIEYYSGATGGRGRYGLVTAGDDSGFTARQIAEAEVAVFLQIQDTLLETGIQTVFRSGKPRFLVNDNDDIHLQLMNHLNLPSPTRALVEDESTAHPTDLADGNYVVKSIELTVQQFTDERVEFCVVSYTTCSNNYSTQISEHNRAIGMRANEMREWVIEQEQEQEQEQEITPIPLPAQSIDSVQIPPQEDWLHVHQPVSGMGAATVSSQTSNPRQIRCGFVYLRVMFTVAHSGVLGLIYPAFKHGCFSDTDNAESRRRTNGYTDLPPVNSQGYSILSEFLAIAGPFSDVDLAERNFSNSLLENWPILSGSGSQQEWHRMNGSTNPELICELVNALMHLEELAVSENTNYQERPPLHRLLAHIDGNSG